MMETGTHCGIEPTDKKAFGIAVYKYLRETYGEKDYYQVSEIEEAVAILGYPEAWECWALVAFMLPANAGEYFRSRGMSMNILDMKRAFIREMTDGQRDMLRIPDHRIPGSDISPEPLTKANLVHFMALSAGYRISAELMLSMMKL